LHGFEKTPERQAVWGARIDDGSSQGENKTSLELAGTCFVAIVSFKCSNHVPPPPNSDAGESSKLKE
jgi:hypothetical protein